MLEPTLLVITGTLTTLLAGVFFGYAVSVNGALHRLKDAEYVRAMQAINVVIQNPLFFLSFMGPVLLLPLVTFLAHGGDSMQFNLLLAATIVYIVGPFGITVAGNVPLNERLARADASNSLTVTDARARFEKPWNRLHAIRTVAAIIASVLFFVAISV
jgi:uncharacterized membrane protein